MYWRLVMLSLLSSPTGPSPDRVHLSVINKGDTTMKPKPTRAQLNAIAAAVGAQWQGDTLCVADWGHVLESASFEGFDVSGNVQRINAQLPPGMGPIRLVSLANQQAMCDEIDRHIPGGGHRAWFENQRRLVRAALAKVEQPHTVTQR
jgi:hypothetical protein